MTNLFFETPEKRIEALEGVCNRLIDVIRSMDNYEWYDESGAQEVIGEALQVLDPNFIADDEGEEEIEEDAE